MEGGAARRKRTAEGQGVDSGAEPLQGKEWVEAPFGGDEGVFSLVRDREMRSNGPITCAALGSGLDRAPNGHGSLS